MPIKTPRGQALTWEQHVANQALHCRRRIEHVHRSVTRCRLVKDRIRLWKEGVRGLVMAICCALHHFRVRLTPWQPMVESGSTQQKVVQQGSRTPQGRWGGVVSSLSCCQQTWQHAATPSVVLRAWMLWKFRSMKHCSLCPKTDTVSRQRSPTWRGRHCLPGRCWLVRCNSSRCVPGVDVIASL